MNTVITPNRSIYHAIVLFLLYLTFPGAVVLGSNHRDIQLTPNQTNQTYVFQRKWSWSVSDFDIHDISDKNNTIKVRYSFGDKFAADFKYVIIMPDKSELTVKINHKLTWCGFKQTIKLSNGVQLLVDPRGILTDRWYIKKSGNIKQKYTYRRALHADRGYVVSEDHRNVAHFDAKTWGSYEGSNWVHSTTPGTAVYDIVTNGEVPIEVLVALYTSSILRADLCGM